MSRLTVFAVLGGALSLLPWSWWLAGFDPLADERARHLTYVALHLSLFLLLLRHIELEAWFPTDLDDFEGVDSHAPDTGRQSPLADRLRQDQTTQPRVSASDQWEKTWRGRLVTGLTWAVPLSFAILAWVYDWPRIYAPWLPPVGLVIAAAYLVWRAWRDRRQRARLAHLLDRLEAGDRDLQPADLEGFSGSHFLMATRAVGAAYLASGDAARLPRVIDFACFRSTMAEPELALVELFAFQQTGQTDIARDRYDAISRHFGVLFEAHPDQATIMRRLGIAGHEDAETKMRQWMQQEAEDDGSAEALTKLQQTFATRDRIVADRTDQTLWDETRREVRATISD